MVAPGLGTACNSVPMKTEDTSGQENSDTTGEQITSNDDTGPTDNGTGEMSWSFHIPALLTNSAREILNIFGEDIIQLHAYGSVEAANGVVMDELREYGAVWEQRDQQVMTIDYRRLPGDDRESPVNPLTEDAREQLLDEVETRLGPTSSDVEQDLAVRSVTIRVESEHLAAATPAQYPEFDLQFVSDPVKPDLHEVTKELNRDKSLYRELGFKVRNLNLHEAVETATKFHQQEGGKYIAWNGPGQFRPNTNDLLAVRIHDEVLPEDFGFLKQYRVAENNTLELTDETVDRLANVGTLQPTAEPIGGDD